MPLELGISREGPEMQPHKRLAKAVARAALAVVMAGMFPWTAGVCAPAKSAPQADSKDTAAVDPAAMEALNKMGVYLRTLKSFQVTAAVTTDRVMDDGQTIQFSSAVDLVAVRPDHFRAEVNGDDGHRFFFYDGKNFTLFGEIANYYATVPAPATIAKLAEDLNDKYGIEIPLIDLFQWGTVESNIQKINAAADIGPSTVEGITCEQYAFRQENLDWQVWIQMGEFPLPRKIVIRTLTDDAKPQHSEVLSWNLAPSFSDDAFTFDPPPDAKRIKIAEIKSEPAEGNQ